MATTMTSSETQTRDRRRPNLLPDATTADDRRRASPKRRRRRASPRKRSSPVPELGDAELLEVEEVDDDAEITPICRAQPVRSVRALVRRAHVRRLREQGEVEPRESCAFDGGGGSHLRSRHPDGRRHRVQERPQGRRAEEGLPRLPAGADGPRRPRLVRRAQHARRHRFRRKRRQAHAAVAQGGREHPRHRRDRGRTAGREEGAPAPRVRGRRAGACGHRPVRRLQRCHQRDRRRPFEAQGAREHLRTRDPGRARIRRRREARSNRDDERDNGETTSCRSREDPDPGGCGNARAAGRYRARPARHQHHGLLQGVQRVDGERSAAR